MTLDIAALTVRFGGLTALDAFALRVEPGEIVGVVGPNGAGKTTLLEAIAGCVRLAAGTIAFGGAGIERLDERTRAAMGIARTHQIPRLFARMSVLDNAAIALDARSGARAIDREASAREALAIAGYSGAASALAGDLAGAERASVELARTLAASPRLLLLDEPFAPHDESARTALRGRLGASVREKKISTLIAERDLIDCAPACDRVIVLQAGKTIAQGAAKDAAADPDVLAAYLGVEWRH